MFKIPRCGICTCAPDHPQTLNPKTFPNPEPRFWRVWTKSVSPKYVGTRMGQVLILQVSYLGDFRKLGVFLKAAQKMELPCGSIFKFPILRHSRLYQPHHVKSKASIFLGPEAARKKGHPTLCNQKPPQPHPKPYLKL